MSKEACREVAGEFASCIIARDYTGACAFLAPWVQAQVSPEHLQQSVETMIGEVSQSSGAAEPHHPIDYRLDVSRLSLGALRESGERVIPEEVNALNYRYWMSIQFVADEATGLDAWFDFWCVMVEVPEGFRIGYYEMMEVG